MQIALTGVSGFIGSVIARHLHEAGHRVVGLVRPSSRRDHVEPYVHRFVVGADQADERAWEALLDGCECVVHNSVDFGAIRSGDFDAHLRSNLDGSLKFLRASAPKQFVFMSSVAVLHDIRPGWAGMIDEDHPARPGSIYGAYKAAVEAHLWAAHFGEGRHTCALRPSAVYGIDPDRPRTIGWPIVDALQRERRYDRTGGGKFVHVDDVAAAVTATIGNPAAAGRVYDLADCYARWGDWAQIAAEVMGIDDAAIDLSSPAQPKNMFSKEAARSLGVQLDRGHEGIREHLREVVALREM